MHHIGDGSKSILSTERHLLDFFLFNTSFRMTFYEMLVHSSTYKTFIFYRVYQTKYKMKLYAKGDFFLLSWMFFSFFPVSCFKRRNNWNPTRLIQQFCSVTQFQNFIMVLCCMRVAIWSGFNCRIVLQSCAAIVQFCRQVINALVKYSFKMHNSHVFVWL